MDYKLIRSNRKTLSLEVTRDLEVILRAPRRCPKREIEAFAAAHSQWVEQKLTIQKQRRDAHPEPDEEEKKALIAAAKTYLPRRTAYYGQIMGLEPAGITITGARTRWGSCSPAGRLCFSWRLMQYPQEAVDYVVVHELAHLVHKNHGPAFYGLVASVLPDYRERRNLLKR